MVRMLTGSCFFFFNDTATTEIYTLSLHDALPIYRGDRALREQHDVVRQVHDGGPRVAQIPEGGGLEKRLDHDVLVAPLDAHRREAGRPGAVERREDRLDDHRTSAAGRRTNARGGPGSRVVAPACAARRA